MKPQKFIFVEFSKGEYEGNSYNNVTLSDGIRAASIRNMTGADEILATLKESQQLNCEFETVIEKAPNKTTRFSVVLKKFEVLK